MKQTAVEWLIDMLVTENEVTLKGENFKLFEMAKAMEREQIIEARNNGFMASGEGWNGEYGIEDIQEIKSEQYYHETFK